MIWINVMKIKLITSRKKYFYKKYFYMFVYKARLKGFKRKTMRITIHPIAVYIFTDKRRNT